MLWDDASLWCEGAKQGVNLDTLTWVRFKDIFYEKYFTTDVRGRLKREFTSLRQGDTSVAEFIRKFERGCHFVPLIARYVAEKLRQFLDGIRPTIHRDVMLMWPADYEAATACAFQAKHALKDIDFDIQRKRQQLSRVLSLLRSTFHDLLVLQGSRGPKVILRSRGRRSHRRVQEKGHKATDCPRNKGPITGMAYVMHAEEAETEPDMTLITGVATYALLDSGATHLFISETFVKRLNIIPEDMDLGFKVSIPSGDHMFTTSIVRNSELRLLKNAV
ncbi:uncharacterized protein [Primulina eburnea]|uniref:uncharacterized protein n=1 Tax=Primulina eburnea TaxID=1245227 RepID=UPI003C6BDCCF